MAPYYMIMRLPGEARAEFFLMLPMVPSQRENMIAWLAARCDPPDYGKLIVYEFPKDKLVYGPFQIEARIQQNTEISQQISLWNQMGSRVIRGHLLVVPIENSILYVSPLYLRAETGQLPELKRVIAAYGDHVVMEETLPAALAALFKETAPAVLPPNARRTSPGPDGCAAHEALGHYDRAIERLKAGTGAASVRSSTRWTAAGNARPATRQPLNAQPNLPGQICRQPAGEGWLSLTQRAGINATTQVWEDVQCASCAAPSTSSLLRALLRALPARPRRRPSRSRSASAWR